MLAVYAAPLSVIIAVYYGLRARSSRRAAAIRDDALEAGLTEPQSLHPSIDPALCLGCGACAKACPEGDVIGLIGGKAELIEPTHCIGHGACGKACPTGAISLVFGTEKRGVDIPAVGPDFQTNIPGIYIAGELGGMGLIRNAIEQGKQAVNEIHKSRRKTPTEGLDLLIVGAGPAGFSATLAAKKLGLRSITIEQEALGGAVAHYPRGKLVMTKPVDLPIIGKVKLKDPSKEKLLELWRTAEESSGVIISYEERVEKIAPNGPYFEIATTKSVYRTANVLLAIGRRGTPRRLGVPGEELPKVVYRMIDPEQYVNRQVLVVGGGDSALEAAAEIAEQKNTRVILSYRGEAFSRARQRNRDRVSQAEAKGNLQVALGSNVVAISPKHIILEISGGQKKFANDDVIICAGGVLPTAFLRDIGVEVETRFGDRI